MTPQERDMVADLFDRLAGLEHTPRDPEAERLIRDGLRQAPNALYALVQTVLVQDEALKRANDRIEELESSLEPPQQPGGFLDTMRDSLFGRRAETPQQPSDSRWNVGERGPSASVPQIPAGSRWNAPPQDPPPYAPGNPGPGPAPGTGGSFLGTAAAAAAGVIGGSLLLGGIRSMFGQHAAAFDQHQPRGTDNPGASPWGGNPASPGGGDLARDAGLNDIGRPADHDTRTGLFDTAKNDAKDDAKNDTKNDTNNDDTDYDDGDDGDDDDTDYAGDFDLGGDSDVG